VEGTCPTGGLKDILKNAGLEGDHPMTYTVIYEKGSTSWGAYVPDLPGVIAVGDSQEEAANLIQEAIEFHLEGLREAGVGISQ
jgi:predicted RNase H-like HicB family nuclease